jgi:hypothetical protein
VSNYSTYGYGLGNLHKIGPSSYGAGIGVFVGDIGVIQVNSQFQWGVQSAIGGATDLLWDVSQALGNEVSVPWNVLIITGDQTNLVWDVSQSIIPGETGFEWNVYRYAQKDLALRWRIFTSSGNQFELIWDTAQSIFLTTTEIRHQVRNLAAEWFKLGHDHYEFPRAIVLVDKEDQGFTEEDEVTVILPDLSPAQIKRIIDTIRIRSEKSE